MNSNFGSAERIKLDLFDRYGVIAAAGDRHLAEFCPGSWYLKNPDKVNEWCYSLTPVSWRKGDLKKRLERSENLRSGKEKLEIKNTGEEGVLQMRALLGLSELITNVNIPNQGQLPDLPYGAVVETNATFRDGALKPVMAGKIPKQILPLISRACTQQEALDEAIANRSLNEIFNVFANDALVTCSHTDAKILFNEMVENTKKYLTMYK